MFLFFIFLLVFGKSGSWIHFCLYSLPLFLCCIRFWWFCCFLFLFFRLNKKKTTTTKMNRIFDDYLFWLRVNYGIFFINLYLYKFKIIDSLHFISKNRKVKKKWWNFKSIYIFVVVVVDLIVTNFFISNIF